MCNRSVDDVEGVAKCSVEFCSGDLIETSDRMVIEIAHGYGDHVVAADHAGFRHALTRADLDLGTNPSDGASDRRTCHGGQHGNRGITCEYAHRATTGRWPEICPVDVGARYHAGAVAAANRRADRISAGSFG